MQLKLEHLLRHPASNKQNTRVRIHGFSPIVYRVNTMTVTAISALRLTQR